jgi:predicted TPR repeat methyltransferase
MLAGGRYDPAQAQAIAEDYDAEAKSTSWLGPEVAFGLAREHIAPGQSVLDLGIGTGLGSMPFREAGLLVHGMDISQEMLDACRWKGFEYLTRHDLASQPYPYAAGSFDHVVCIGVLPFFRDLSAVFAETQRLLKTGGLFVFVTADRTEDEKTELVVGPEHTGTGQSVTMYRHSRGQISRWLEESGFISLESVPFVIYMDSEKTETMPGECYAARKAAGPGS